MPLRATAAEIDAAPTAHGPYSAARAGDPWRTLPAVLRNARLYAVSSSRLAPQVPTSAAPVGRSRGNGQVTDRMFPTSISFRCSVSWVALDISRIATAAETA